MTHDFEQHFFLGSSVTGVGLGFGIDGRGLRLGFGIDGSHSCGSSIRLKLRRPNSSEVHRPVCVPISKRHYGRARTPRKPLKGELTRGIA